MVVPPDISDRLLGECLGRAQSHSKLSELCDTIGGRVSGAESGRQAEQWAHDLLKARKLEAVRFEEFAHTAWIRGSLEAELTAPFPRRLTAVAHANSPADCYVSAPAFDAGHGERTDYKRDRVDGKIILCDELASPGERVLHRTEKLKIALERGAIGMMVSSAAPGNLPRTGVCHYGSPSPIPSIGITKEDAEQMRRLSQTGHSVGVSIRMTNQFLESSARNVLADIPGTEQPDQIVLAGAHLDSWDISQGASDNGIGTVIVLECARAIASLPRRPRRTIRFALWAAEELGLRGSLDYTRRHNLASHTAVMNFDMTGDPCGFWTPGFKDWSPVLYGLSKQLTGIGMTDDRDTMAKLHSDHQHFMLAGVPVIGLKTDRTYLEGAHYYHTSADTFDKVSLPMLARASAAAAHTLWALADSPEPPLPRLSIESVRAMIDEAGLREALNAEGIRV